MDNYLKPCFSILISVLLSATIAFGQETAAWKGKIEYQDGVKVTVNPEDSLYGEITLELEEDLVIGNDTDENTMFFQWLSVAVDMKENIYVMDRGNFRIQVFDKTGKFLHSLGREGEGPGEFQRPTFLSWDQSGNLCAKDGPKAHIIDKKGDFLRSVLIPLNTNQFTVTADGNVLGERMSFPPENLAENVALLDEKTRTLRTIASYPSIQMDAMFNKKSRFNIQVPKLCLSPMVNDRTVFGFSSEYKLNVVDPEGNIIEIIDYLIRTLKERRPNRKEARNELQDRTVIPRLRPFFSKILCDEAGNIFLLKHKSYLDKEKWEIYDFFNNKGLYLYRLKIDETIRNIGAIHKGYIYLTPYNRELECFQVKRLKIKDWGRISRGHGFDKD